MRWKEKNVGKVKVSGWGIAEDPNPSKSFPTLGRQYSPLEGK